MKPKNWASSVSAALLAASCVPAPAAANAVAGVAHSHDSRIDLFSEAGLCVGVARQARYVPKEGAPIVGCWVVRGGSVFVVFLDADIASIPLSEIKPPAAV